MKDRPVRALMVTTQRGFTLIELLAVIAIIAILIGMLMPAASTTAKKSSSEVTR